MKKEKIKIGNVEVDYTISGVYKLFEIYYNQECNPDRINKLKHDISQFNSIDEKIQYCRDLYSEYRLYLHSTIRAVSGMSIDLGIFPPDAKLFFDEKIQIMIDSLEAEKLNHKNQIQKKSVKEKEIPKKFEEIFYDVNLMQSCIDVLKQVEPPLIDSDCNFIGKPKGAICVWIDEMQRQAIIKHFSDRKQLAILISDKIKNFSINDRMFDNHHSTAERQYRDDFKALISKNKISSKK